jgi:hypothetical protein
VDRPPVSDIVFKSFSALLAEFIKMHSPGLVALLTIIFEYKIYLKFRINSESFFALSGDTESLEIIIELPGGIKAVLMATRHIKLSISFPLCLNKNRTSPHRTGSSPS